MGLLNLFLGLSGGLLDKKPPEPETVDMSALAWAESRNNPEAESRKGARGHIQMMPRTYAGLETDAKSSGVPLPDEIKGVPFEEAVNNPELLEVAGEFYLEALSVYLKRMGVPVNARNLVAAWNMGASGYAGALEEGRELPKETTGLLDRYFAALDK